MTPSERLQEAENALHDLNIGRQVVEVTDQNGERIRYAQATRSELRAYIADLKRQINGTSVGPMQFWGR
jgi:hypothetical protein